MSKEKNPVGRPLAFKTVKDLEEAIDSYFRRPSSPDDMQEPWRSAWDVEYTQKGEYLVFRPTVSGLAIALGVDRKTINNYSHKEKYFPAIKKALSVIENVIEKRLYGQAVTGLIFNLKNNFDWKDKTEQDITSGGEQVLFNMIGVNPDGSDYTPGED
jgi:hypothetical protein